MPTANKVPKEWAKFHREKLEEAIGDAPIITISKEPMDWGTNIIQEGYGYPNLYKNLLKAAKLATTKYIGIADDDTLYSKEHFDFRPPYDGFWYDFNRWHLATWGEALYFYKPKAGNGCLIATRELYIEKWENRIKACPELTKYYSKEIGASRTMKKLDNIDMKIFYGEYPIVSITHEFCTDKEAKLHAKRIWPVRAYDLPRWRKAEDIRAKFV